MTKNRFRLIAYLSYRTEAFWPQRLSVLSVDVTAIRYFVLFWRVCNFVSSSVFHVNINFQLGEMDRYVSDKTTELLFNHLSLNNQI